MADFYRPNIPYLPPEALPNDDRYALVAAAGLSITALQIDGDINYLIAGLNDLSVQIAGINAGILVGSNNPDNVNKFPVTDGAGNITWTKITPLYFNNGSVTTNAIADAAVIGVKIGPAAVTEPNLAPNSVTTLKIFAGAVGTNQLANDAVTTAKIDDEAVTSDKIEDGAVGTDELEDEGVTADKIADNTITAQKIANTTITATQIANNTITNQQLALASQFRVGFVMPFAGTSVAAIPGWLFCNGQEVNRAGQYAPLFAAIGTAYGAGDNVNTFNVPDCRGRVIVGIDMNNAGTVAATNSRVTTATMTPLSVGGVGGFQQITLDVTQIPPHSHTVNAGSGNYAFSGSDISTHPGASNTSETGGGQPHNNMQPSIFMQAIIYTGV